MQAQFIQRVQSTHRLLFVELIRLGGQFCFQGVGDVGYGPHDITWYVTVPTHEKAHGLEPAGFERSVSGEASIRYFVNSLIPAPVSSHILVERLTSQPSKPIGSSVGHAAARDRPEY